MCDDPRIDLLLNQVQAFTRKKFGHRIPLDPQGDPLAQLIRALNELGGELQSSAASRQVLAEINTRLWRTNKHLDRIARVDPLTKLLNRRGLEAILEKAADRAMRQDSPLSAVLIDCDNFKSINDMLGHVGGDQVLQAFADRMTGSLRASDHLGRVGGDEFLAILPDTRFHEGMLAAERMRTGISHHPLHVNEAALDLTASMGVTTLPLHVNSIEEVLTLTRLGLKRSKELGKNRVTGRGDLSSDASHVPAYLDTVDELRAGENTRAVAQPILSVANEDIVGYELLSRRDSGPYQMPSEFFRIALESNVLTDVDLRCAKVCIQEAEDRDLSGRLHVNLFPSTLLATKPDQLLAMFPPKRNGETYCVEISEQQFIGDPAALKASLSALKDQGVLIAVDDVGFGRTSLETLLVLEPDIIKIDRQYVTGIADDRVKSHRLERMVHAVGKLGAELVAKGVEERKDFDTLATLDLPFAQGYLWGQPA